MPVGARGSAPTATEEYEEYKSYTRAKQELDERAPPMHRLCTSGASPMQQAADPLTPASLPARRPGIEAFLSRCRTIRPCGCRKQTRLPTPSLTRARAKCCRRPGATRTPARTGTQPSGCKNKRSAFGSASFQHPSHALSQSCTLEAALPWRSATDELRLRAYDWRCTWDWLPQSDNTKLNACHDGGGDWRAAPAGCERVGAGGRVQAGVRGMFAV